MLGMWKWKLTFQCTLKSVVRGTKDVRTRVDEVDISQSLHEFSMTTPKLSIDVTTRRNGLKQTQAQNKVFK